MTYIFYGPFQSSNVQSRFYGSSNSWRSSLTTISPVGTSWSSNRFVMGPLEPWSFFISANRISVLPKKSECGGKSQTDSKWWKLKWEKAIYPQWGTGVLKENNWPSGENWSRSNTVTQRTSCSRSFMKNWQLEFHLGFSVSCVKESRKRKAQKKKWRLWYLIIFLIQLHCKTFDIVTKLFIQKCWVEHK